MKAAKWPTTADQYVLQQEIGKGATSLVYTARCPSGECAVKVFRLKELPESAEEQILKEISTLSQLDHPAVIKLYASFVKGDDQLWMVMPLVAHGSVLDVMRDGGHAAGLPEECIGAILGPTLEALVYLHGMNAIHRDLKAGNIFLSLDGQVVLGDFGVAAQLIEGGEAATGKRTFAGTPCWMAPEVMMQQGSYASPADMWSFGITAIELAKGRAPHADLHAMKVVMKVMSSQPPSLDEGEDKNRFSKPFRAMVKRCLVKEPMERPTAAVLQKDPFFKKVKDAAYLKQHLLARLPPIWERRAPKKEAAAATAAPAAKTGRFGALAAMVDESTLITSPANNK